MAQRTDAQLTTEKEVIKNETVASANSATRIGEMLENINDSKINNDKIDTDAALNTSGKTLAGRDALKTYIANVLAGLGALTSDDIDTLVEINAILSDADLVSQTALNTALDLKLDALTTPRSPSITGAHTLDATDLAAINDGKSWEIPGDNSGALTIPLNATVAFPVGTYISLTGFTSVVATGGVTLASTRGGVDYTIPSGYTGGIYKSATNTWALDNGLPDASATGKGLVELATDAEAITGTSTVLATTPANVKAVADFKENLTNKATDFSTVNNTLYPSVEAVNNQINSLIVAQISHSDLNLTGL